MRFLDLKNSPILRLLTERKKAPKEPEVSQEILVALRSLTRSADWVTYKRLLDIFISNQVKSLLTAGDDAEVHRLRGYIQGLLHAAQIPEQLIQQEDHVRARASTAASLAAEREQSAAASLYATGHWGN